MKIVIDTNVIISAVFFGGQPRRFIEHFFNDEFTAFASPEIVKEYVETYEAVHKKYESKGNLEILQKIIEKTEMMLPQKKIAVCRDKDDDKFISCAIEGNCLYIVSGDNDLLSLGKVENVEIITIADFLKMLEREKK